VTTRRRRRPAPPSIEVGVDVVDVARMARSVERGGRRFRERVFTRGEWAYAAKRGDRADVLAARFAVKEAVMKALGTGWGKGVAWTDVEVVGGGRSKPRLRLRGKAAAIANARGLSLAISLSHAGGIAAAVAVASTSGPRERT
jgi:holo-[acyl-carrier protein] synthase